MGMEVGGSEQRQNQKKKKKVLTKLGHACAVASVDKEGRLTEQAVGGGIDEGWGHSMGR